MTASPFSPSPADDVADRLGTRTGPRRAGLFLWWLPLLAAAVAGAVVYAWTASHDDVYRARVALLVPAESSLPPESYAGLAVSGPVLREVIQSLRLDLSVDELADDVRVSNSGLLLEVEVDAPTPGDAEDRARTLANVLIRDASSLLQAAPPPTVLSPATAQEGQIGPHTARNTALAVAAGLAVGLVITGLFALRQRPLQSAGDVEWLADLPTIGEIPRDDTNAPLALRERPHSQQATAHYALAAAVERARALSPFRSLLVVGADRGAAAADVAANLALASAHAGRRVLLLDADLRRPQVHRLLRLNNDSGLSDALLGGGWPHPQALPGTTLAVLTSGSLPADPAMLLGTHRLATLLSTLRDTPDLVIVTAPPSPAFDDAALLAPHCDAALLVVDAFETRPEPARTAAAALRAAGTTILGEVITNAPGPAEEWRYPADPAGPPAAPAPYANRPPDRPR